MERTTVNSDIASARDVVPSNGSRRTLIQASAALALTHVAGLVEARPAGATDMSRTPSISSGGNDAPQMIAIRFEVNTRNFRLEVDSRITLLDALRENIGMTGSKKGCDHGQRGACTVLLDGRRINACLTLAVMHDGQSITTIDGLASGDVLHPMQAAFLRHDGFQCGYCTPGQIGSSVGMSQEERSGMPSHVTADLRSGTQTLTDAEIRERMSGNLCRCSAYIAERGFRITAQQGNDRRQPDAAHALLLFQGRR